MNSFMNGRVVRAVARHTRTVRAIVAIAGAGMAMAACDVHGISAPGTLSAIAVSPNPRSLAVNATAQFTAVGTDFSGATVAISPVWSIVSGGGAISTSGMFTAGTTPGTYTNTVKATSGSVSSTATVTVTVGPLATITVTPTPATLTVGGAQTFVAVGKDASGNVVTFTPTWSVVAGGGSVTGAGIFTAGTTTGTFVNTVQASNGGITGTATVIVTAGPLASIVVTPNPVTLTIGGAQQFTAAGRDASGNAVVITPTWSVVAGGGTTTAGGLFTAGATPGTFTNTVQATSGGLTGTATVIVAAGPLATLTVTPNPVSLTIGGTQTFTAVGRDASGNVLAVAPSWSLAAGGGAIGFSTGVFTAGNTPGTYTNTVRASVAGVTGFATVTVAAGPLASIVVTPNPVTLQAGSPQQFTATGADAAGNAVTLAATWSVANGGGTISSTGVFTAGAVPGTFAGTVQATSGAIVGSATVTVTAPPPALAAIVVSPNPGVVLANGTQQFSAVGRDGAGAIFPITPVWSVVNGGGSINPSTGVFTAGPAAGTYANTIRATSGGVSGTATVTVTALAPVLATITITPNPASILTGGSQLFTAVGRDANGQLFPIVPVWTVVNGGGSIDPNTGLFLAGGVAGTFTNTVRATSGAISGFATVDETAPQVPAIVTLGTAALNGIMAGTAVTCVNLGLINANVAISGGNTITGFGPCQITGVQHLNDAIAIADQIALGNAYNTLAGLPCGTIVTANLGGTTLLPGVYCSASTMGLTGTLTLDGNGNPNATFVFQVGSGLTTAGNVLLINGAQAKNVYWQVGSSATLGTASQFQGNILALTSITLVDNANLIGRALARNGAVTLGTGNTITLP